MASVVSRGVRAVQRLPLPKFRATVAPKALGIRLGIDPSNVFQLESVFGVYQPHVIRFLLEHVRPGATVLTAGAAHGYIPLVAARLADRTGRVFTAEPDPVARASTLANIALNAHLPLAPVTVLDGGLSDTEGDLALYQSDVIGHSSLAAPHHHKSMRTTSVVRGDDWLAGHGVERIDVVVLDIEGWECQALRGLARTLRQSDAVCLVEESDWALRDAGYSVPELRTIMRGLGYGSESWDGQGTDRLFRRARPMSPAPEPESRAPDHVAG